ncbi:MAG: hypothetical protein V1870_00775 [Candidatus Aenigmatarchaeota archaeon]
MIMGFVRTIRRNMKPASTQDYVKDFAGCSDIDYTDINIPHYHKTDKWKAAALGLVLLINGIATPCYAASVKPVHSAPAAQSVYVAQAEKTNYFEYEGVKFDTSHARKHSLFEKITPPKGKSIRFCIKQYMYSLGINDEKKIKEKIRETARINKMPYSQLLTGKTFDLYTIEQLNQYISSAEKAAERDGVDDSKAFEYHHDIYNKGSFTSLIDFNPKEDREKNGKVDVDVVYYLNNPPSGIPRFEE